MRIYNGKPMINSVNGKQEVIEEVMPLVAKYGGVLVSLVLDEDGIPETADKRIEIAEKIYKAADSYGIPRSDIVIDGLCGGCYGKLPDHGDEGAFVLCHNKSRK